MSKRITLGAFAGRCWDILADEILPVAKREGNNFKISIPLLCDSAIAMRLLPTGHRHQRDLHGYGRLGLALVAQRSGRRHWMDLGSAFPQPSPCLLDPTRLDRGVAFEVPELS